MTKRINYLYKILLRIRNRHFFVIDVFILIFTTFFTYFMMSRGNISADISLISLTFLALIYVLIKMPIYYMLGLYKQLWRYASIDDLARLLIIGFSSMLVQGLVSFLILSRYFEQYQLLSFYFPFFEATFSIFFIGFIRFSIRLVSRVKDRSSMKHSHGDLVLIVGAGKSGVTILDEMQSNYALHMTPVAFVDDDPDKQNMKIRGISVVGTLADIPEIIEEYSVEKVVLAMPTAVGSVIKKIVEICDAHGIKTLTVPGIYEILRGNVSLNTIREIRIEDLLRRHPVKTNINEVSENLNNKVVLITGAGGSIGSEMCRQILNFNPQKIVLLGHGENSIFDIENELKRKAGQFNGNGTKPPVIKAIIADLRFSERIYQIFDEHRPHAVFHAAAHKHVPLMENNPAEAISNNIHGTINLVNACKEFNIKKCVGISTDKAVNPTNIMGATKRVAEMIILNAGRETGNYYSVVRFGNVLGSRGSVVRTFKKQIQAGGPITITHPEINRFFMTIPEAVQLVLQASVLGSGSDIFVLDMGKPIKIVDLARDMINLSGLKESEDIEIVFTGLRPGEKLFEELFIEGEKYTRTKHEKIFIAENASSMITSELDEKVLEIIERGTFNNRNEIVARLKALVPEYYPEIIYSKKDNVFV